MTPTATSYSSINSDRHVLRDLVKQYLDVCSRPDQAEKRERWKGIHALDSTEPAVLVRPFLMMHEVDELRELRCDNPELRGVEQRLRRDLFVSRINDDTVFEPFLRIGAVHENAGCDRWGVPLKQRVTGEHAADNMYDDPPLKALEDIKKLCRVRDSINERATAERLARVQDMIGDLIAIDVDRHPLYGNGKALYLIPDLMLLRGMMQVMLDMHDNPAWLHRVLAYMRDTVLESIEQAEQAGDWRLADSKNQAMPYARELPDPAPNTPAPMDQLWGFFHAQEYTLISPAMHDEFALQYQMPLMAKFGLTAYGCCEDLTEKIDMLRQVPNLRRIAVTPRADVVKCAERIGRDYAISWRPNPANMISCGFDEAKITHELRTGVKALQGLHYDITLKDVITVEHDMTRLPRWVELTRHVIDEVSN